MASGTVKRVYESSRDRTYPLDMWFFLVEAWWRRSRTSSLKDTLITHSHQTTHLTTDDLTTRCVYCTPACLFAALFLFPLLLVSSCAIHVKINQILQHSLKTLRHFGSNQLSFLSLFNSLFHLSLLRIQCTFTAFSHYTGLYVNYI